MLVRDALCRHIIPLRSADAAREVLAVMDSCGYDLLPVTNPETGRFAGMVSREAAAEHSPDGPVMPTLSVEQTITTVPDQPVFEVARLMERHDITLLPVVDAEGKYVGLVERSLLHDRIIRLLNLTEYGSLLTIHFEKHDFMLSKPVQIIESEGGLIMGLTVTIPDNEISCYKVIVKLNLPEPVRVVAALKRHGYVVDLHSSDSQQDRRFEERADELMHYLNL